MRGETKHGVLVMFYRPSVDPLGLVLIASCARRDLDYVLKCYWGGIRRHRKGVWLQQRCVGAGKIWEGGGQLQHGVASIWVLLIKIDGVFSSLVTTQPNDDAWYGAGREFFLFSE